MTHKASVSEFRSTFTCGCWHRPHHQTACALAPLNARRGSLPRAIRSHLTADFHLVFWYPMRKCSFSERHSMLPFEEDFLGTVFTFILIQVVEYKTDPVGGELKRCLRWHSGGRSELQIESERTLKWLKLKTGLAPFNIPSCNYNGG